MTPAGAITVRPYAPASDEPWAVGVLDESLGGRLQARRGEVIDVLEPGLGLVVERDGRRVGLLTWRLEDAADAVELAAVVAATQASGIGTALLSAFTDVVRSTGRTRVRVVTTNDNLGALRFYQRRGFRLVELRPGAVDDSRVRLKPSIGEVGDAGIPLRDELELELVLD